VHSKKKWTIENFSSTDFRNILLQYSHSQWAMHDQILGGKATLQYKKICCMNRGPMQHDFWVTASCRLQEILEVSTRNFTTVNLQLELLSMSVIQRTNSSLFHLKHQTGEMFEYTYIEKAYCILCSAKLTTMNTKQVVCTENIYILSHSRTKNCPATDRWQRENGTFNM
jgi:hypothetical protein